MVKKKVELQIPTEPFHEMFPFALEWYLKEGNKKLQHHAYFPYDDYRNNYAKRLKGTGAIGIRKFKTKPRN